ncbi:hypothetical protein L1987_42518 [Smallanthus sonchifolius]|uniref:Uncharacterized protein n=1 Tax=Smallanthus sonchifolius TaxID=185202 RepID=A0ACB9GK15_9ASTR|nr:hypothetical protein L1987_42518 [Smallanthus sonchifolius]
MKRYDMVENPKGFQEIEEPPELLELEEAPELQKPVETLQMQVSTNSLPEKACELQFADEDEIEKSEVQNLLATNIEMDNPLPSDYKQFIYYSNTKMMKKPQRDVIFPTKEEAYSILSTGVLIKVSSKVNMGLDANSGDLRPPLLCFFPWFAQNSLVSVNVERGKFYGSTKSYLGRYEDHWVSAKSTLCEDPWSV